MKTFCSVFVCDITIPKIPSCKEMDIREVFLSFIVIEKLVLQETDQDPSFDAVLF